MLKVYCDICGKEDEGKTFRCQVDVVEVITDLTTAQKSQKKDIYHICQSCYKKHISKQINVKK